MGVAEEPETQLTRTEARGGSSNHVTRYVLPISLGLLVAIFVILLIVYR